MLHCKGCFAMLHMSVILLGCKCRFWLQAGVVTWLLAVMTIELALPHPSVHRVSVMW